MPFQFVAVRTPSGAINKRKILLIEFDATGAVVSATRQFSSDIQAEIIYVWERDFDRLIDEYHVADARGRVLTPDERRALKNERSRAYRAALRKQRKTRPARRVDAATAERVVQRLRNGERGVVISVEEGVSTSYVGRMKHRLEEEHGPDADRAREA